MIKFHIEPALAAVAPELTYLLKTWGRNQQLETTFADDPSDAISVGLGYDSQIQFLHAFQYDPLPAVNNAGIFVNPNGQPDHLLTALYMLNSLQEYNDTDKDDLGRYKFANSYQFKQNKARENIVQACFDEITKAAGLQPREAKTRFFLSHDIDTVHGAIIEDGFNVLKRGRIDLFFQLLFNLAVGKPDWLNIDKIMKIESEYDCKSVFFWIMNKGKINKREKNADYSFASKTIQRNFKSVEANGFENGLHKSISKQSFAQEFNTYGQQPFSNRYHYLKFNLPNAYHDIETAKLKLDASLGFAEEVGFRNSYGLPFNPFNFVSRRPFTFVEVPLHIMDRTYFQYKKYPLERTEHDIFEFFEKNRNNCVISILWHNNFFTNYKFKGYLGLYKKILTYIRDNQFGTISQQEILKKYSIVQ